MKSLGIIWAQYGPYHMARVAAMKRLAGSLQIHALELADQTLLYDWKRSSNVKPITLCPGSPVEKLSFQRVFHQTRRVLSELEIDVCFLPSYAPSQSLAAFMAAKSLGLRTVLMNESHAGTSQASGAAAWVKRRLVRSFDAALVGGKPQTRYLVALGLPQEKIFTGYDAVDNDYFAQRAGEIRERKAEFRCQYELPEDFFLSLGRFIPKKNLAMLIRAFHLFLHSNPDGQFHLVMVGSGEEFNRLTVLCQDLGLPIYDKSSAGVPNGQTKMPSPSQPGVHFYGFRQIKENPVFYALADAFVLPSLREEWGLVVNEAMASGLPVIVSETAGCCEDLLRPCSFSKEAMARTKEMAGLRLRQNGFAFDPNSTESLAQAFRTLAAEPELRETMGQASQGIVEAYSCASFASNAMLAARTAVGEEISTAKLELTEAQELRS